MNFQALVPKFLKSRKFRLRPVLLWVHLWTSLVVGAFILVVTLSGSALIFYPEINKLLYPEVFAATPGNVPLEQVYRTVQAAHPHQKVEWIFRPIEANSVYRVQLEGESITYIFVDPGSGHILGAFPLDDTLVGWFTKLHTELFLGQIGTLIVGVIGIFLLIATITGIYLWWPGLKKWMIGWVLRWKRGLYIRLYDLHKLLGIITVPVLLIIVLTGIAFCFYDQVRPVWYAITFTAQPEYKEVESTPPSKNARRLTLDQIAARAHTLVPDGIVAWINVPGEAKAPAEVWLSAPFDPYAGAGYDGQVMVQLDQYSGATLDINDPRTKPWNVDLFENWLFTLHVGSFGGIAMRIIYLIVGLTPTALAITGVWMWLLKRSMRRRQLKNRSLKQQTGQITITEPLQTLDDEPIEAEAKEGVVAEKEVIVAEQALDSV